jgi:hypothetical protein
MGGAFAQHLQLPEEIHQGIGLGYQSMNDDWEGLSLAAEEKRDIVFCYAVSRMAEFVVLENDEEYLKAPSFNYDNVHRPELFQLEKQLNECGLSKVEKVISSINFRTKTADMIANLQYAV